MEPGSRVGRLYLISSIFASFHFSLLLFLTCLFFMFPCTWLTLHVSWGFPIICSLLFIPTVLFFLFASFTDTSILRKGIEEELVNQVLTMRAPRQHWCNRCQLHGLPHTFHCPWCNTCVEDFDHHCIWLNNCVGRHNIHFFILFVVFLSGYNTVVMASCLAYLMLNTQEPFSVEKICTIVVTIPTTFYLLPLLIQLSTQLSKIWTAQRKLQAPATHRKCFRSHQAWWRTPTLRVQQNGSKFGVQSATSKAQSQKARKALVMLRVPPVSSFHLATPNFSQSSGPQDKPSEWKADKAWHHFLDSMRSVLRRKDPAPQPVAEETGKKKCSWPQNTTDRSTEIPVPELPESLQLLDEDQNINWKGQLYVNRHGPPSPTSTLLSLSDI